jgi:hypothetical protein
MNHFPARSPRIFLGELLQQIKHAKERGAAAREPFDRAQDQAEHASALVRAAQDALDDFDRQEAQAVGQSWPPRSPSPKARDDRRELEDNLATSRRTLSTVQKNVEAARIPAEQAALAVVELTKQTNELISAVLSEEGEAALARLLDAQARAVAAEGVARSIAATMVARRWLTAAEKLHTAVNTLRPPEPVINVEPYFDFIERLTADADAVAEAWSMRKNLLRSADLDELIAKFEGIPPIANVLQITAEILRIVEAIEREDARRVAVCEASKRFSEGKFQWATMMMT